MIGRERPSYREERLEPGVSFSQFAQIFHERGQRRVRHRLLHLHARRAGLLHPAAAQPPGVVGAAVRQRPVGLRLPHAAGRRRLGVAGRGQREITAEERAGSARHLLGYLGRRRVGLFRVRPIHAEVPHLLRDRVGREPAQKEFRSPGDRADPRLQPAARHALGHGQGEPRRLENDSFQLLTGVHGSVITGCISSVS